jgi:hypothetical protein
VGITLAARAGLPVTPARDAIDPVLTALARRALLVTLLLSLAGSGLGVVGITQGVVTGAHVPAHRLVCHLCIG